MHFVAKKALGTYMTGMDEEEQHKIQRHKKEKHMRMRGAEIERACLCEMRRAMRERAIVKKKVQVEEKSETESRREERQLQSYIPCQ